MGRRLLHPHEARRLLTPGPVVLVTTRFAGLTDVAPVAWCAPLSAEPTLIGIALHPARHTHDMVRASGEFALSIPGRRLLHHVQYFGTTSGLEEDKLGRSKLPWFRGEHVSAPLLEGCLGWIECSVEDARAVGDHTLYIGRLWSAQALTEAFDDYWLLEDADFAPLHYLGGDRYAVLNEVLQAQPPEDREKFADEIARQQREEAEREAEAEAERQRRGEG